MKTKKDYTGKTASAKKKISMDIIENRAHEIYMQRAKNGIAGNADSDWLQAEKELMN